jgi:hypothetical protein
VEKTSPKFGLILEFKKNYPKKTIAQKAKTRSIWPPCFLSFSELLIRSHLSLSLSLSIYLSLSLSLSVFIFYVFYVLQFFSFFVFVQQFLEDFCRAKDRRHEQQIQGAATNTILRCM